MKPKKIAFAGVLILCLVAGVFFVPHQIWSYSGPGTMRDDGVLSYPRYKLELPSVAVGEQLRSFTFTDVPSEAMSLKLYIPGSSVSNVEELQAVHLQITAQLFEEATALTPRRLVCSAEGSPDGAAMESRWVVTGSSRSAALWHSRCLRVPISAERRYTLMLEIAGTDSSGLVKVLVPTLEGGGFELP
jgi:hypothetical protein